MASKSLQLVLISCFLSSLFFSTTAQTCTTYTFSSNKLFKSCNDLPALNAFLHWNFNSKTSVVDLAYRQPVLSSSRWVSWAINPTSTGMAGAQSLVAFQGSDGVMKAYTSPIVNYKTRLEKGDLSFPVYDVSAEFGSNEMIIFARIGLPNLTTAVNHLWQEGPMSGGDTPGIHALSGPNVESMGTLDFRSGVTVTGGAGNSKQTKRNKHGWLCVMSWGVLMPLGVMSARYLKVFKSGPAWFYLHLSIQIAAYGVGVAGWGTGLKLGSESSGIQYNLHRNIGISLFCLATLQVFALLLRPKPEHKYRLYWTIYHQVTGYTVIILSIINVFKGLDILDPGKKWKQAYIIVLAIIGGFALLLEPFKLRKWVKEVRQDSGNNGV